MIEVKAKQLREVNVKTRVKVQIIDRILGKTNW